MKDFQQTTINSKFQEHSISMKENELKKSPFSICEYSCTRNGIEMTIPDENIKTLFRIKSFAHFIHKTFLIHV
jgi:hypothetical protein